MDYREIDFKGGLELHQQINTRKLFCECQSKVRYDKPPDTTKRKLHAVASELGEYDPAALHEAYRDRTFFYQSYHDSVCLVELDEEPPHPVNRNALRVVLDVSLLLKARIVDEIQVMRKTVIDGSNTAGFQRTMLVATDGIVNTDEGDVTLQYFCLEEDAARIIDTTARRVTYRLDRLGIPLLEIVTGPNCKSPEQAGEVANKLGHIIRSLNVKRGIGSIRQDVNVSTKYGTRIEIKGVQRHRMIPTIMAWEAERQVSLYNIAQDLKKVPRYDRDLLVSQTHDVTDIFRSTESERIRSVLEEGGVVSAVKLPGFRGYLGRQLCPNKRLGTEMKDQVLTLGVKGVMHADEDIAEFGISTEESNSLNRSLDLGDNDSYIFFASNNRVVNLALGKLYGRIPAAFDGVPKESRRALPDGNSQYMRPLPGEARMYPETDIPPVIITEKMCGEMRNLLPVVLEEKIDKLSADSGIPAYDLWKIEEYMPAFLYGIEELGMNPTLAFRIIGCNVVGARRKTGEDFDNDMLKELLRLLNDGKIIYEGVPALLEGIASGNSLENMAANFGSQSNSLKRLIETAVEENSGLLANPKRHEIFMGILMDELRGKVSGRTVAEELDRYLERISN